MEIVPLSSCPHFVPVLAHWAYLHWYLHRNVRFSAVEADYKRRANESVLPISWVALERGMPIGMVSLKEYDLQSHRQLTPWLSALYVIPQFRKKGVGEGLIARVIAFATEKGYHAVHLFTDHRNTAYLSGYYEKRGWMLIERAFDNDGNYTEIFRISFDTEDKIETVYE
jgi:predicted N-acetyltransferase YhbS